MGIEIIDGERVDYGTPPDGVMYMPDYGACLYTLPQVAQILGVPYKVLYYHVSLRKKGVPEPEVFANRLVYWTHDLEALGDYFKTLTEGGKARWTCRSADTPESH